MLSSKTDDLDDLTSQPKLLSLLNARESESGSGDNSHTPIDTPTMNVDAQPEVEELTDDTTLGLSASILEAQAEADAEADYQEKHATQSSTQPQQQQSNHVDENDVLPAMPRLLQVCGMRVSVSLCL